MRATRSIARTLTSAGRDETAINSKYDPQTLEANKDYTMTAPLFPDGSNFPCKVSEPARSCPRDRFSDFELVERALTERVLFTGLQHA